MDDWTNLLQRKMMMSHVLRQGDVQPLKLHAEQPLIPEGVFPLDNVEPLRVQTSHQAQKLDLEPDKFKSHVRLSVSGDNTNER